MKIHYKTVIVALFTSPFILAAFAQEDALSPQRFGYAPLPQADIPSFIQEPAPPQPQPLPPSTVRRVIENNHRDVLFLNGRSVFLNGVEISSIRNQQLENVSMVIDEFGNILIKAPQYEVSNNETFHPLLQNELPKFDKLPSLLSTNTPFDKSLSNQTPQPSSGSSQVPTSMVSANGATLPATTNTSTNTNSTPMNGTASNATTPSSNPF